ncbi:MAG: TonB-dependent receptor [Gammaproteobacteria bacterium]|nr:TonB-dependent receptor [Gammaproteobacteria bacterium]
MQHRIRIKRLALTLVYAVAGAAEAAKDTPAPNAETKLDKVVVTATRSEKALEKIPGAVTVITEQELAPQLLIAEDPSQALTTFVPGYSPSRQTLSIAGETLRGRRALILLDGIPQSTPVVDGRREGYFADPAIIERIEVVSGPSAIYGLGATGGIINYISKTPRKMGTEQRLDAKVMTQFKDDSLGWKTGYRVAHKNARFDVLGYVGVTQRGIAYDGDGRRIGTDTVQGNTMDSTADDVFLKAGANLGPQRWQFSFNRFKLEGDGDYRVVPGNRAAGIPTTSERGTPPGNPPRNRVQTASIDWYHSDLGGGLASVQIYKQDFAALFGATNSRTFQDPAIAPAGTLMDQSDIVADKWGVRTSWLRPDLFMRGLELSVGLDYLRDVSEQRLALTNRTWVPPIKLNNLAPFAQLEYERGPFTVRGGARREYVQLDVDTYRTLASSGNREVQGGTVKFAETVLNLGAIWRLGAGWSTFASYNEGFGLPNVGRVLRGVNTNGQSVENLINLQPVLTDNKEVGLAWRGTRGAAGLSYYESSSDLGSTIRVVDGVSRLERLPVNIKGWELNGDWKFAKDWSLFGLYSWIRGKTATAEGQPLDVALGSSEQGPDKLVVGTNWAFSERGAARLQASRYYARRINEGRRLGLANLEENFSGYTVADLAVTYKSRWGDLGLGIENLLDKQYILYNTEANPAGTNSDYFAGRGRTYTLSYARTF